MLAVVVRDGEQVERFCAPDSSVTKIKLSHKHQVLGSPKQITLGQQSNDGNDIMI